MRPVPNSGRAPSRLRRHLDRFLRDFPLENHIEMDPVQFVHRYEDGLDREIAGFVASALAYGNVRAVLASVQEILEVLGPHPAEFVTRFRPEDSQGVLDGFFHRWSNGRDVRSLLWILGRLLESHGSLETALKTSAREGAPWEAFLSGFSTRALSFGHERFYTDGELLRRRGVRYFFPKPSDGSACKRLNLFLRWMVRPDDGVDCGVWSWPATSDLIIPVDTHIARISRYIGLTEVRTPGWKMALDITRSLKRLDPRDPLRYDFALCHLGIARNCPKRRDPVKCRLCPIQSVCRL